MDFEKGDFMKTILGCLAAALCWGALANVAPTLETKLVTALDGFEPFEAHLFHDGLLWVGSSRKNMAADYKLEVFDAQGNAVASTALPHALSYIYAFGPDSVLIVGTNGTLQLTQYSIARWDGSQVSVTTRSIPETAWADRWAGNPRQMYFTDPGGNTDDPGAKPGQPAETLFTLDGSSPKYLSTRIPDPQDILLVGNSLFLVEQPNITQSAANLVRVDLASQKPVELFPTLRKGLLSLVALDNGQLAVSEPGAGQVLLIDEKSSQLAGQVPVAAGAPRGLAQLGKCLVVGSEVSRHVSFFDLTAGDRTLVADWDLSGASQNLMAIRDLAVDPQTGAVFARSAYPCTPFSSCGPRNGVVLARDTSGETLAACRP
jgi:hypothetical protein